MPPQAEGHRADGPAGGGGGPAGPPPVELWRQELRRSATEFATFCAAQPLLQLVPRGKRHPVLVLAGFLAGDESTLALRGYLRTLGYQVHGWRLGRNLGPSRAALEGMTRAVDELGRGSGQAVTLIGWSLGGIYARQLARRAPDRVQLVVTLGSPFRLSNPSQSRASRLFDAYSHLHVPTGAAPAERETEPLPVPATSVFSRTDGVVAWQACLDGPGPRSENVEVRGSHCGLGHNVAAAYVIADRLAQQPGAWTPFRPPALVRHLFPARATRAA